MKTLSNKIKEYQINEWTVKEGDEKISKSFAARYRAKYSASQTKFYKFKKFFEELEQLAGLYLFIWAGNDHDNYNQLRIMPYRIREHEPNKTNYNYNSDHFSMKTYKSLIDILFDNEDKFDINSSTDVERFGNYYLYIRNIDEYKSILESLGFEETEFGENNYVKHYNVYQYKWLGISFKNLYDNIDKIYKAFFE